MRVVVIVGVALALALPGSAAPPRRAALQLESVSPLVVRGQNFGRVERVAVVASQRGTQQIVNLTARNGRFTAAFTIVVDRCKALNVRAIGSLGSRAILRRGAGCAQKKEHEEDEQPKRGRRP